MPNKAVCVNLIALLSILFLSASTQGAKPNIIYILTDDWGYGDVSCYNPESKIETPWLDSLAKEGMRFTHAYSNSAVCTPTRYGVLTGRYTWRSRLKSGVLQGHHPILIEKGRTTVASMLKNNGYSTAMVGKWHLGLNWAKKNANKEIGDGGTNIDFTKPLPYGVSKYGFDYSYIHPGSLDMSPYVYIRNDTVENPNVTKKNYSAWIGRNGFTSNDFKHVETLPKLLEKAKEYLRKQVSEGSGSPFFLYFAMPSPHHPIVPAPEFKGKSTVKLDKYGDNYLYGDFIIQSDWVIGQIMQIVDSLGIRDSTMLVMTSDNGPEVPTCLLAKAPIGHYSQGELRGFKRDTWEGGVRVPFVARWPGKIPSGSVCDESICLTDFMATAAAIVGYRLESTEGEDSYSILPVLLGKELDGPIKEASVVHSAQGEFAIIKDKWKLIDGKGANGGNPYPLTSTSFQGKNIRGCGSEYVYGPVAAGQTAPEKQLYNLAETNSENNSENQYDKLRDTADALKVLLEKYKSDGRSAPEVRTYEFFEELFGEAPIQARRQGVTVGAASPIRITVDRSTIRVHGLAQYDITVFDLRGKLVLSEEFRGGAPLSARQLKRGIYLLRITSGPTSLSRKVIF